VSLQAGYGSMHLKPQADVFQPTANFIGQLLARLMRKLTSWRCEATWED